MAAAINYNDIVEIVKSNASSMKVILDSVGSFVKVCSSIKKIDTKSVEKVLKDIKNLMPLISDVVFSIHINDNNIAKQVKTQQAILTAFNKNMEMIKFISTLGIPVDFPMKLFLIKSYIKNIMKFVSKSLFFEGDKEKKFLIGAHNLQKIRDIFSKDLIEMFAAINNIKYKDITLLNIKLSFIKNRIWDLNNFIHEISGLEIDGDTKKNLQNSLKNMYSVIDSIKLLFDSLSQIKSNIFLIIKLKIIRSILKSTFKTVDLLHSLIDNSKISKTYLNKLEIIKTLFNDLGKIFLSILLISPASIIASIVIWILIGAVKLLSISINLIIKIVSTIRGEKQLSKDIAILGTLFAMMGLVFLTVILVTPVIAAASLAMLVILGGLALISLSLWLLSKLLTKLPWFKIMLGLVAMNLVMLAITTLSMMLLVVALCASQVAPNFLNILILLGSIITVTLLVGAMGLLFGTILLPLTIPVLLGLGSMTLILGAVVVMSIMLSVISNIKLNKSKIIYNTYTVIDTAKAIIDALFNEKEKEGNGVKKPWYENVIIYMGGPIINILNAILSISLLSMSIVSVFLILIIAGQLRLLQEIRLDNELINYNVSTVLDICKHIINSLFDSVDDKDNPSNKGFIIDLINYVSPQLGSIIESIMSVAFLALSLVSISIIILIAGALRLIQNININKEEIDKKISDIINIAKNIVSLVFAKDDTKANPKEGNVFKKILNFVSPELSQLSDAIMSIGVLGVTLCSVGILKNIAETLVKINNLPSLNNVNKKVSSILNASNNMVSMVMGDNGIKKISGKQLNKMKLIKNLTSSLKNIYSTISEFDTLDTNVIESNKNGFGVIISTINALDDEWRIDVKVANKKIDVLFRLHNLINKFQKFSKENLESSRMVMDNYIRFVDKIGNVDIENLKTTENIFAKMAEFSHSINGDFEKLADSLNEKIMPLLEKLENSINNMNSSVSEGISKVNDNISESNMTLETYDPTARAEELKETGLTNEAVMIQIQRELALLRKKDNKKDIKDIYDLLSKLITGNKIRVSTV